MFIDPGSLSARISLRYYSYPLTLALVFKVLTNMIAILMANLLIPNPTKQQPAVSLLPSLLEVLYLGPLMHQQGLKHHQQGFWLTAKNTGWGFFICWGALDGDSYFPFF